MIVKPFISHISSDHGESVAVRRSYVDVGDRCWRRNVLVTTLVCFRPIGDVGDRTNIKQIKNGFNEKSRQHLKSVTIIKSSTSPSGACFDRGWS